MRQAGREGGADDGGEQLVARSLPSHTRHRLIDGLDSVLINSDHHHPHPPHPP